MADTNKEGLTRCRTRQSNSSAKNSPTSSSSVSSSLKRKQRLLGSTSATNLHDTSKNPTQWRKRTRSVSSLPVQEEYPCKRTRSKTRQSTETSSVLSTDSTDKINPIVRLKRLPRTIVSPAKDAVSSRTRRSLQSSASHTDTHPEGTSSTGEKQKAKKRKGKGKGKSNKGKKPKKQEEHPATRGHLEQLEAGPSTKSEKPARQSTKGKSKAAESQRKQDKKKGKQQASREAKQPKKSASASHTSTSKSAATAAATVSTSKSSLSRRAKKKRSKRGNTGTCPSSSRGKATVVGGAGLSGTSSSGLQYALPPSSSMATGAPSGSNGEGSGHPEASGGGAENPAATSASNASAPGLAAFSLGGAMAFPDQDGEDPDMGRLQALLEARGLPSHLFGALGPRMHQLLHRSMGRTQQLLQGLQATGDEGTQLTSVIEMCQVLVMGNEDTLAGFPVKQVVPALITLVQMEHNFDIMHHACRALTYMMEALPRSSAVVVDAVPAFLEKLQTIQCMDVAEQALQALEMLSRRHGKTILQAGGISACLVYLDFFSITAQRAALGVTANCCQNVTGEEFKHVRDNLALLSTRLTTTDKKCVENTCLCFSRLVENYTNDERTLKEIAAHGVLTNVQQLLVQTPPLVSGVTFVSVLRMLVTMCANCPDLAVVLHKQNIGDALCLLLTGTSAEAATTRELQSRSPQELYEIVCLISELMPMLPTDGLFQVDSFLRKVSVAQTEGVMWQWRDDRNMWRPYSAADSKVIEMAYRTGDDEVALTMQGRVYSVDFHSMQQINEDTDTARAVQRRAHPLATPPAPGSGSRPPVTPSSALVKSDSRADMMAENAQLASNFIRVLFSVLYEVYSSSAGPAVRHKCMQALLRMIYYAPPELLKHVLNNISVSSHIASMMASQDLKVVVAALQMATIFMEKLPDVFSVYFHREGVMHQVKKLGETDVNALPPATPTSQQTTPGTDLASNSSALDASSTSQEGSRRTSGAHSDIAGAMGSSGMSASMLFKLAYGTPTSTTPPPPPQQDDESGLSPSSSSEKMDVTVALQATAAGSAEQPGSPTPALRLSDVLKRKKPPKRSSRNKSASSSRAQEEETATPTSKPGGRGSSRTKGKEKSSSSSSKSSFLASLHPSRWGRASHSSSSAASRVASGGAGGAIGEGGGASSQATPRLTPRDRPGVKVPPINLAENRLRVRKWIHEKAVKFSEQYGNQDQPDHPGHAALGTLNRLCSAVDQLQQPDDDLVTVLRDVATILSDSDVSPFEILHSGLVARLLTFLTSTDLDLPRDLRLRHFLHVFMNCPPVGVSVVTEVDRSGTLALFSLVNKLMACAHHLEQFQVKLHDLAGCGRTGAMAGPNTLRFFNTHQLKCNLERHADCKTLRQWKGGPVKIDPLALVQAIERYLVMRGYARPKHEAGDDVSDEDGSDDDIDDTMAAVSISQGTLCHRLEFLIGDQVLPYTMTVYQAVKQFSPLVQEASAGHESDVDGADHPYGGTAIWVHTHTIWYREARNEDGHADSASCPKKTKSSHRQSSGGSKTGRKGGKGKSEEEAITESCVLSAGSSSLELYLTASLPAHVTVNDPSLAVLTLLRVLHGLTREWSALYQTRCRDQLVPSSEFLSSKLTAKATRQLQDPLGIMTGNLPGWLSEIAIACPFLLPFESRQMLFYATSFDRDRAMQRLLDSGSYEVPTEAADRVTPRLEKRKRLVSREDVLRQAESLFDELTSTRALLEIQYQDEVGTGLGPTLEFYALVSREMQRADLGLWRGDVKVADGGSAGVTKVTGKDKEVISEGEVKEKGKTEAKSSEESPVGYMYCENGLYPAPVPRHVKAATLTKIKAKFKFLGRFMAKAIMDFRVLDLPLNPVFYKWLLGHEHSLTSADLIHLDPVLARSYYQLETLLRQKHTILTDITHTAESRALALESLTLDGCPVEDLGLDFVLPGYPHIELKKGGKDIAVTLDNLHEYLKLVCHWTLVEGVQRQFEAFREGFESIFQLSCLSLFYPEEMDRLFCGSSGEAWTVEYLSEVCRPDHGYNNDSRAVQFLYSILASYDQQQQRNFLQFVTGSPKLPVGGLKSLSPPLTVVRKSHDSGENESADEFLPSVMTCVNYLKLPDYSSIDVMRHKLELAAREGQLSFHLS